MGIVCSSRREVTEPDAVSSHLTNGRPSIVSLPLLRRRRSEAPEEADSDHEEDLEGGDDHGDMENAEKGFAIDQRTYWYMRIGFAVVVLVFCLIIRLMWALGVMQVVLGNMLTYVIGFIALLLVSIPLAICLLQKLLDKLWKIPGLLRQKLWEIPPMILPMLEGMMKGLLQQMEERIISKLTELPRETMMAMTRVGGKAADLGKKGFQKAKSLGRLGKSRSPKKATPRSRSKKTPKASSTSPP